MDRITIVVTFAQPTDSTPPAVQITSPADGAIITGSSSGIRVNVTGTASDVGSVVRVVELTLDNNISGYTQATPSAPGNWSIWSGSLLITTAGDHSITARCTDTTGNVSESRIRIAVSIVRPYSRLLLVEIYRLSSYLGSYGAGRVLKTFSLLPGEKTKISVRTFTKRETTRNQATSILDSFTQTSADDFETSIAKEQSDKNTNQESFGYKVSEHANAS
jgi:hypothetical protein